MSTTFYFSPSSAAFHGNYLKMFTIFVYPCKKNKNKKRRKVHEKQKRSSNYKD